MLFLLRPAEGFKMRCAPCGFYPLPRQGMEMRVIIL
jgi:hypothetical protein